MNRTIYVNRRIQKTISCRIWNIPLGIIICEKGVLVEVQQSSSVCSQAILSTSHSLAHLVLCFPSDGLLYLLLSLL